MTDLVEFVVGRPESNHVRVRVLRRMHEATDYDDGNWLVSPVEVHVASNRGAFDARVRGGLRSDDFRAFRRELQELAGVDTVGTAELLPVEPWLTLRITRDALGHLQVVGSARDLDQPGAGLTFELLGLDQTDLTPLIAQLEEVELAYPVVGEQRGR